MKNCFQLLNVVNYFLSSTFLICIEVSEFRKKIHKHHLFKNVGNTDYQQLKSVSNKLLVILNTLLRINMLFSVEKEREREYIDMFLPSKFS